MNDQELLKNLYEIIDRHEQKYHREEGEFIYRIELRQVGGATSYLRLDQSMDLKTYAWIPIHLRWVRDKINQILGEV